MTDTDFDYPSDAQGVSSALGAWGAAWQSGRCSPDDVLDVLGWWSARHRVLAADAVAAESLSLDPNGEESDALLRLIRSGVSTSGLAVLLVAPGDMLGLPPRGPATTAALESGELLVVPGQYALVPRRLDRYTIGWGVHTLGTATVPIIHSLAAVEYELREGIRSAADLLDGLRMPRTGAADLLPDPREKVAELTRLAAQQLPPGVNARAERILEQAAHVAAILAVAQQAAPDFGFNAGAQNTGDSALRELGRTVRVARMSATNAVISELLSGNRV
jgi:hypothetical protein